MADTTPEPEDEILKQLIGLQKEGQDALASFQKRVAAKSFTDPNDVAVELKDLFTMFLDSLSLMSSTLTEQFEWGAGVDEELDAIRAGMPATSGLLPTDAEVLKQLLGGLKANLRAPSGDAADQQLLANLAARTDETLAFIEQITLDPEEDEDDEEDDEDEDEES